MTRPGRAEGDRARERVEVTGVVQGVGFRPHVHRLATELGLAGHVGNDPAKVFIEVEGTDDRIERFVQRLAADPPPLARIAEIRRFRLDPVVGSGHGLDSQSVFRIVASRGAAGARTLVPPDTAACTDCVAELLDPADRRHRHPFITCTNCGPRFTIITDLPYDRPATSMAGFELCAECRTEYTNPADRRYHAQPISCHDCGPTLWFEGSAAGMQAEDPIRAAQRLLGEGGIVAVKGLGGYHLACDATDAEAVAELRRRKHRPDKPLAVMVTDLDRARSVARIDRSEADLMLSPAAPVVLVRALDRSPVAGEVAPGNPLIGLMVPYTPIHHLLLESFDRPLVMTSANVSGEPLVSDRAGIESLAPLYDGLLDHDRPIANPCDDSVVRVMGDRLLPIRRARGYAPIPIPIPSPAAGGDRAAGRSRGDPAVLAVGAELKNTCCLAAGGRAWVSQHLGDMQNLATMRAMEATVDRLTTLYRIVPDLLVADAHPGYLSSGWARRRCRSTSTAVLEVQHHRAHVAAVAAEAGLAPTDGVIGFAFDGTGYGDDGAIWGGEVLAGPVGDLQRVAHLAPILLPGGDAAIANPWRVALAHLFAAGIDWTGTRPALWAEPDEITLLQTQLERGVACVPTTSMGRLFDAVSALIGLRQTISYEAQAAIDLEIAGAEAGTQVPYRFGTSRAGTHGPLVIDPGPVLVAVLADLERGDGDGLVARRFHEAVAAAVATVASLLLAQARTGGGPVDAIVLSGGVFQNVLLTRLCLRSLTDMLERSDDGNRPAVLTHHLVPPNDGGLALGQAYLGLHRGLR